jgi:3-hydroxybutyrate dehydrogenase
LPASPHDLTGQVAVVTGSTSGIGRALAEALVQAGAKVVLNGLGDPAQIEQARAEMGSGGGDVRYHGADMTRPDQIADLVAYAEREFGRLDILVNNAGVQHVAAVEDFPLEKWDFILAVNLSAVFHATRAALPIMKRQGRGRVVNVASAHSLVASPFKSAYVAAKHGVAGFTKSVALEVATTGVTINCISPGYVRTPLVDGQIRDQAVARGISEEAVMRDVILAAQPTKKFVEYDQLSGLLLYLVSDAGASANGANFSVDGGWTAQ